MGRPSSPLVTLGSAALLVIAMAGTGVAQSPSAGLSGDPGASQVASGAAPSGRPAATAVGPIVWKRVTKGKDFTRDPAAYGVEQLPDGRLIVVGSVGGASGLPRGAAWTSPDGVKWSRAKIRAPRGSSITAVADLGRFAHRGRRRG